ncbi:MAG: fluoride efflux transporter CrcB [Phycisphaerales bacterium]|nr:fluoride efflux transporter CrcB [Phycisphaerales bacterium]
MSDGPAKILFVALGGALGSVLRYLLSAWINPAAPQGFPLGTLAVNVTGCLAIGALGALMVTPGPIAIREEWRLGLFMGVLGGYTTFSSFAFESLTLAREGQWTAAAAYVLLSNLLGLGAAAGGYLAAARLAG